MTIERINKHAIKHKKKIVARLTQLAIKAYKINISRQKIKKKAPLGLGNRKIKFTQPSCGYILTGN